MEEILGVRFCVYNLNQEGKNEGEMLFEDCQGMVMGVASYLFVFVSFYSVCRFIFPK